MRFLLDTHIWLWMLREPHKLSSFVHQALYEPSNERYLSPVSVWEITVLLEKKRITLNGDFGEWFARTTADLELTEAHLTWQVVHEMRYILPNTRTRPTDFLRPRPLLSI